MSQQELDAIVELLTSSPQPENPAPAEMRERFERLADFLPLPDGASVTAVDADGVPAEWVSAAGVGDKRAILYLHGGGYVIGSLNTHRRLACDLSAAADARVLVIDYRMGPENPFPAAIEDAIKACHWLLAQGVDAGDIAIAGDSAGGGLTMATLGGLKDEGANLPACAVVLSPWVDLEGIGDSMTRLRDVDPMVSKEVLDRLSGLYLNGADVRDPQASPIYADLSGLPPLLIQVGTRETLLDDSRRLHARAQEAGVQSTLEESDGMIHVWHLFAPMLTEGREAIQRAGEFIRQHAA